MTTSVVYTLNFAGDFTTFAAAQAGIGTIFTASSTGNVLGSGSTTTAIQLAAGETADFTGHPITIGGTTRLITSYNVSTKVATISARAGFAAAFPSAPASGTSYTIADVAVTLTIGQSASGNNLWAIPSSVTFGPTTSATNTLTFQGATPWSFSQPARFNAAGSLLMPVALSGSNSQLTFTASFVTFNDLQVLNLANSSLHATSAAANFTANRCFFEGSPSGDWGLLSEGTGATVNNCVLYAPSGGRPAAIVNGVANDCVFFTNGDYPVLSANLVLTGCALYGYTTTGAIYFGAGNNGSFGVSMVRCAAQSACCTTGGITVIPLSGLFISTAEPVDFRPAGGSGLLGIGGAPGFPTDLYGVTRSASASTIGISELAFSPPAIHTVTFTIGAGGDLPTPTPSGVVSSLTWAAGVATLVTSAPHNIPVGNVVPLNIGYAFAPANGFFPVQPAAGGQGGYVAWVATATGASTFTWALASDPGSAPVATIYWSIHGLNMLMGGAYTTGDLTYYQSGLTCPATASSTSTIVLDASATTACIGHPIQWKTGATGMITAYNATTHVATIAALAGFPATFGGTPQVGDAYTIFPTTIVINIGPPTSGHTLYVLDVAHPNAGSVSIGPGLVTSPTNAIVVQGTLPWDPTAALGTVQDGVGAIAIQLGVPPSFTADHTAVIGIGASNVTFNKLQIWDACTSEPDGCFLGTALDPVANSGIPVNVAVNNCLVRSDSGTDDQAHSPFVGQGAFDPTITFTNCVLVSADYRARTQIQAPATLIHCTMLNTANAITTTVGDTPAGSNAITVANVSGLRASTGTAGSYLTCPTLPAAIPYTAGITTISGNTLNLQGGPTTADIPSGTPIYGMVVCGVAFNGKPAVMENTAIFGMLTPADPSCSPITLTSCASDSNVQGLSGVALVSYPASLRLASGAFGGRVDARPLPGNRLQAGTFLSAVPTDIFGLARRNPPTIGAVENTAGLPMMMYG